MTNSQDDKLGRLLDKIDRLTVVLENMPMGESGRGGNITPSLWRRSTQYDYKDTKRFKDLTKKEQSDVENRRKEKVSSFDKMLKQMEQSISKNEKRVNHEKRKIDVERYKINEKLNDPNTLLTERKSHKDRLKELRQEEIKLDQELNKEKKKELGLRKKRDKVANQKTNEFWYSETKHGPDYGSISAWEHMIKENKDKASEYQNDYNVYAEQARRDRHTNTRKKAAEIIYEHGMGNTAFGRFSQNIINRNQRIDDYANFGRVLQGEGGKKIATAMFGSGKTGQFVTNVLGKFGSGLTKVTGSLSKFGGWIGVAIEGLKLMAKVAGEWMKYTAKMTEFQMQEEQLQYENSKRIATLTTESNIEDVKYAGDIQLKMMDVQSQNLMDAVSLSNDHYVNAVQSTLGDMMQGINASAYQAAENRISESARFQKNENNRRLREDSQARYNSLRTQEYYGSKSLIEADKNIANVDYATKSAMNSLKQEQYRAEHYIQSAVRSNDATQVDGGINPVTGVGYEHKGRYNNNGTGTDILNASRAFVDWAAGSDLKGGVQAKAKANLELQNQRQTQLADYQKTNIDNQYKLENTKLKYSNDAANKQQEVSTEVRNKFIESAEVIEKTWLKLAQHQEQYLDKIDKATNNTGISMGFTNHNQLHSFQLNLMRQVTSVAYKFGKDAEEVARAQSGYIETTGRNKTLGEHDYGQLFGLGKYLGDDNLASQFGSEMEIFNHGIEDSVDMLHNVLQDVNKIGLNGRKYTKDLVNNLKLAHKYNFKDGTKGLMEMAKWAQNTRFNIGSLDSMLSKAQEGGIEGIITQAAGLQVLGGHSAINSDPLGMLYDAWADPAAYAKRMQDMTKGFGVFNSKTGETEFNINESMQIAQIAKLQGRSAEELRNEIIQRNKQSKVESVLDQYAGFDKSQKALISNKAEYKNGKWVVKMNDGSPKDVSELSKDDLQTLMPTDHNERMEDYMQKIITALDKVTGAENFQKTALSINTYNEYLENYDQRVKNSSKSFLDNYEQYLNEIKKGMVAATQAQSDYYQAFKDGNVNVENARSKIEEQANNISIALAKTAEVINAANTNLGLNNNGSREYVINGAELNSGDNEHVVPNNMTPFEYNLNRVRQNVNIPQNVIDEYKRRNEQVLNPLHDGITSGNGNPMFIGANDIVPIHDGQVKVAKSDPKDTAIFAKSGGPFDKLFDGIFGKVNVIYDSVSGSKNSNTSSNVSLTINGKIELTGENGQSINITETLKRDPMFVKALTEMITKQLQNNANGGRNELFPDRFSA